ncbi:hypothetical protein PSAC2689_200116 [Paraburkholderia sacchari]
MPLYCHAIAALMPRCYRIVSQGAIVHIIVRLIPDIARRAAYSDSPDDLCEPRRTAPVFRTHAQDHAPARAAPFARARAAESRQRAFAQSARNRRAGAARLRQNAVARAMAARASRARRGRRVGVRRRARRPPALFA